jgi:hypothetical protein
MYKSLSLSHTHTHTHTLSLSLYLSLSLSARDSQRILQCKSETHTSDFPVQVYHDSKKTGKKLCLIIHYIF